MNEIYNKYITGFLRTKRNTRKRLIYQKGERCSTDVKQNSSFIKVSLYTGYSTFSGGVYSRKLNVRCIDGSPPPIHLLFISATAKGPSRKGTS